MCVHGKGGTLHRTRSQDVQRKRSDDKDGIKRDVGDRRVSRRAATEVLQERLGQTLVSLKHLLLQEVWSASRK